MTFSVEKVLFISNAFPPRPGGGVIRPSRLAKHFFEYGWKPIILTMVESEKTAKNGQSASLYADVVIRVPKFDMIFWLNKVLTIIKRMKTSKGSSDRETRVSEHRFSDSFMVPDIAIFWVPGAVLVGLYAVLKYRPAVIFSMSPDSSGHLVGLLLKLLTRKKWVADFRDPWISNPFRVPKKIKFLERLDRYLEKMVVKKADHITVTSSEYKLDFLQRYPDVCESAIKYVPNGYDPDDFTGTDMKGSKKFTVAHVGNFYGSRRSSDFLNALAILLDKIEEQERRSFRVLFVGILGVEGQELVLKLGLTDVVSDLGPLPHFQALSHIVNADLLLLIPGPGNGTMPGKVYEYLAAQKPIFCISEEGPAKRLIKESGIGRTVSSVNVQTIALELGGFVSDIKNNTFVYPDVTSYLETFNRKNIAKKIIEVFESV